jgi:gliding motility-associated-like protein
MTITVITVTPTFTQVAPVCSGGMLSALPTASNNGITGSWSPALNNLATTTYIFTPSAGQCAETVSMTVTVNPLVTPTFTQVGSICSGGSLSALPVTSLNGIVGSWSPALNNTATTIYTFTPNAGQCATTASMTVAVTSKPIITVTNNTPSICSGNAVDLTLSCINLPNAIIHWQYPPSAITGGSGGSGAGPIHLTDILTLSNSILVPTTITLTVYAEESCRGDEIEVDIIVNPLPKPMITDGYICVDTNGNVISDYVLNTGLNDADHTFVWYYNENVISGAASGTYVVDQISEIGQYSVEATNIATTCKSMLIPALVESSDAASTATYAVSNYFEDNQSIILSVVGSGIYLYSLDGGPFQESNIFSSVPAGEHFVTIHDANGCADITIEPIFTIGYPHFFTPNGDGYHDTWNIWSLPNQKNAEIHIFDRLGKLIKQIKPEGEGWDGTFNGQDLPSTDYWFTVKFNENQAEKIFKAHFSLKR